MYPLMRILEMALVNNSNDEVCAEQDAGSVCFRGAILTAPQILNSWWACVVACMATTR
jgi:hypothetical protein